ncbi:MAG: VOC family protein [Chloroflexota bacterium]
MAERSRLRDIVIDCARASSLAAFWARLLDYRIRPYTEADLQSLRDRGIQDPADDPEVLLEPTDGGPRIWFVQVPEGKAVKNRIHLDVNLRPGEDLAWVQGLGALLIGQPEGRRWTIFADPEGNEFCVFPIGTQGDA